MEAHGFRKVKYLYGEHLLPASLDRTDSVIILVEGAMDTLTLRQALPKRFIPLGMFGTYGLTEDQLNTLKRYKTDIIIWTDPDKAGLDAFPKIGYNLLNNGFESWGIFSHKDPGDLSTDEIQQYLSTSTKLELR